MKVELLMSNIQKGKFIYNKIARGENFIFTTNFDYPSCLNAIELYFQDFMLFEELITFIFPNCTYTASIIHQKENGIIRISDIDYSQDIHNDGRIGTIRTDKEWEYFLRHRNLIL